MGDPFVISIPRNLYSEQPSKYCQPLFVEELRLRYGVEDTMFWTVSGLSVSRWVTSEPLQQAKEPSFNEVAG